MYLPRLLEGHIRRLNRTFPVLLITGARQVGKTTLLRKLAESSDPPRAYASLDDLNQQNSARQDPALFLQRLGRPVVIDEIQNAPVLLEHIKPIVDNSEQMGSFWLSGSQHYPLMQGVSESLAGRVAVVDLYGLSSSEDARIEVGAEPFRPDRIEGNAPQSFSGEQAVFERIVRGSFPRLAHPDPPPLQDYFGSYLRTYVERDVRAMSNISSLDNFQRFMAVAAARVGQLVNLSELAREVGISVPTAKEWLGLLQASYQIVLIRPFFENLTKRQVKTPKLFFTDTGLACFLTGWRSAQTAALGAMAGPLFENHVVVEIFKSYRHRGQEAPLWFFRDKEKREVDLLIHEDGKLFPVEIKRTASPSRRDLKGFEALRSSGAKLGRGAMICLVDSLAALAPGVDAIPVGMVG